MILELVTFIVALAYAEFWFTDLHWPVFTKETLLGLVAAYQNERPIWWLIDEE